MKKGKINGTIYNIIGIEEYQNNNELYDNKFTAIEKNGMLYPVTKNKNTPGFYNGGGGLFGYYVQPEPEMMDQYRSTGDHIIDFNAIDNIKDLMEKNTALMDMEKEILCSSENEFKPIITETDTPEMRALKEAVIAKGIDLEKYKPRFGKCYDNDRRLFKTDRISFSKLKSIGNNLDMTMKLVIEDASPDVANPIGKKIEVTLIGGYEDNE